MLPFWKLVGLSLYIALFYTATDGFTDATEESWSTSLYVALPVLQCLLIVLSSKHVSKSYAHYSNNIGHGLFLSICGDAILVFHDDLSRKTGGFLFVTAHLFYLRALGMKPFGPPATFASFGVIAASVIIFLQEGIPGGLEGAFAIFYILLLCTVAWRFTVRFQLAPSLVNFLAAVGALCFIGSDYVLLRHWFVAKWEYGRLVAMGLYYAAQLGFALSATDDYTPTRYELMS